MEVTFAFTSKSMLENKNKKRKMKICYRNEVMTSLQQSTFQKSIILAIRKINFEPFPQISSPLPTWYCGLSTNAGRSNEDVQVCRILSYVMCAVRSFTHNFCPHRARGTEKFYFANDTNSNSSLSVNSERHFFGNTQRLLSNALSSLVC